MSDFSIPEELQYTSEHEWLQQLGENKIRVGITDFAQDHLGDIVFVQLPEIGQDVSQGDSIAQIESTKSVADLYAPISGKIVAVNEQLDASPDLINSDPYGEGWITDISLTESELQTVLEEILDAKEYYKISSDS